MSIVGSFKQFLYINSQYRISGTGSSFAIEVQLPTTKDFDTVCMTQISIPVSYYLIRDGANDFMLTEGVTTVTIKVPAGNYNINSFTIAIAALLNANSPNGWVYTATYPNAFTQNNTGKITYTVVGNTSQPLLSFPGNDSHLSEQFGFDRGSTISFAGNTLISANVCVFVNEDTLFIHSDICDNGSDDILQEIYTSNNAPLSIITYLCPDINGFSKRLKVSSNLIMNFYLTDENNKPIDLNGLNMLFTLLLYKRNKFFDIGLEVMKHNLEQQNIIN